MTNKADVLTLMDEVSRLTKENAELTEDAVHAVKLEDTFNKLMHHLIDNNVMSPRDFFNIGIMVTAKDRNQSLEELYEEFTGQKLEPCDDPDCDVCYPSQDGYH